MFTCFKLYINTHVEKYLKYEEIVTRNKEALVEYQELIEYGTTWRYQDFVNNMIDSNKIISDTKVTLTLDGQNLEENEEYTFNELKDYELIISLKYNYLKENKTIENNKQYVLKVVDTTPPILNGLTDKTIIIGDYINIYEGLSAFDTVDGEVPITVEGSVNNKEIGNYKIIVSASDSSGNTKTGEYTVIVNPKITSTTAPTTTTTTTVTTTTTKKTTTKKITTTVQNDVTTKSGRLYMAKQEAKKIVKQIIKPGMSDYEKAEAIYNYLHSNVALQTNQSNEAYKTNYGNEAYAALVLKVAACSGFCKAVTLLCDEAGLQSQHVNANLWIHQWNRVLIDGEWIVLDAQGGIFGGTSHPLE